MPHLKAKLASPKRHVPMTRIGFWLKRLKLVQTPEKKHNCPHVCPETYLVCCWNYHTAFLSSTVSVQSISALIVAKLLQLTRTSQEVLCWSILRQGRPCLIHRICCLGGVRGTCCWDRCFMMSSLVGCTNATYVQAASSQSLPTHHNFNLLVQPTKLLNIKQRPQQQVPPLPPNSTFYESGTVSPVSILTNTALPGMSLSNAKVSPQ